VEMGKIRGGVRYQGAELDLDLRCWDG